MRADADVSVSINKFGQTMLNVAAERSHVELIDILLAAHADIVWFNVIVGGGDRRLSHRDGKSVLRGEEIL